MMPHPLNDFKGHASDASAPSPDLSTCPNCGGPADNGHDRCLPPSPYLCKTCQAEDEADAMLRLAGILE